MKNAKEKSTVKKTKDSEIDYSDLPEFSSEDLKKFKRIGRPLIGDSRRIAISVRMEKAANFCAILGPKYLCRLATANPSSFRANTWAAIDPFSGSTYYVVLWSYPWGMKA